MVRMTRKKAIDFASGLVRRMTISSYRRPRATLAIWLGYLATALGLGTQLSIETSISSLLNTSSPTWETYQRAIERHGSDEFVTVLLPTGPGFEQQLASATKRLEAISGVGRVDSLASVALIRRAEDGSVDLRPAIDKSAPIALDTQTRGLISRDLIAPDVLMSREGDFVALNVVLDENVTSDRDAVVSELRTALPDSVARLSGVPIFRTRINQDTQQESASLLPYTALLIAGIVLVATRSIFATCLPLSVGLIGSGSVVGALAVTGTPLSLSTLILPTVLLALGCAYSMHFITVAWSTSSSRLLEERLGETAIPVSISGLTTSIGFLSISGSQIGTIRELGLFGAFGVIVVTLVCITALPAALSFRRPPSRPLPVLRALGAPSARWISSACLRRSSRVVLFWIVICAISLAGATSLKVSTNIVDWYPEESTIRSDYEVIRESLSGITPVSVLLESSEGRLVTEPDMLAAIDALSQALEARRDVGRALSVSHPLRSMEAAFNGASPTLPSTLDEAEQYLLLLDSEEAVWDLVSRDRLSARVMMRMDENASDVILGLSDWINEWWRANGPEDFEVSTTGIMFEFARTNQAIVGTQVSSLIGAIGGLSIVLFALTGTIRQTVVALVPNLVPLWIAYGALGLFSVPLDAGIACLGSLALGIAIDDTVHIVSRFAQERKGGADLEKSFEASLSATLPALFLSTVCIVAGFSVLGFSELGLVRNLGSVTASVVALCWAADVSLLPSLLKIFEDRP